MKIRTELLHELTISRFSRMQEVVDFNPPYQREGGLWKPETKSRLIDSILNGLDVPKIYFEKATTRRLNSEGLAFQYAVIDGKQRLESIAGFLDGRLRLPNDFWFFEEKSVRAGGMTLDELSQSYPGLARRFLDYELPVVSVSTDSGDLIEEMFQRLNASSALNAAERRNAISGPTRTAANELAEHALLTHRSPIKNARYKYRELAAKFLAIEHQLATRRKIVDTKADTLYELFAATRVEPPRISDQEMRAFSDLANETLDAMAIVFDDNDPLLASIGTVVVYYIVFRAGAFASLHRTSLVEFEEIRRSVARMDEDDADYGRPANARLREYNVLVQSTNDGRALSRRADILRSYLTSEPLGDSRVGLDELPDAELPDYYEADL